MLLCSCSAESIELSRLLVGERPTGSLGEAGPRASCGKEMVPGGIRPYKRTPPNVHWPNRTWREKHQLRKSVEDLRCVRGNPVGVAVRVGGRRRTRDGIEFRGETWRSEDQHCCPSYVRDSETGTTIEAPACCDGSGNSGTGTSYSQGCSNTEIFSGTSDGSPNTRPEEVGAISTERRGLIFRPGP